MFSAADVPVNYPIAQVSAYDTPLHVPLHDILFGCHIMSSNTCTCILLLSTVKCRSSSLLRDSFILVV
jgi:hypothetical protein